MMIRRYRDEDTPLLWRIYHDTTHLVNGRDYTRQQCERWAPSSPDLGAWAEALRKTTIFVAVDEEDEIVGFAQLEPDGKIGLFYCRHDRLGQGIGKALYAALEETARAQGNRDLTAHVSVTARNFFLGRGFEVVQEQQKIICGAPAPNSIMCRKLAPVQE